MPRSAMLRSVPVVASIVAALLLAVKPAAAEDVSRTIYVPEGWEGAYEFGYAPVLRVGETVIVSGVPAGGDGTYEEKIRGMYTRVRELLETARFTLTLPATEAAA